MQVNPAAVEASGWGWRHATRKDFALRAVDFTIRPGERVLLLGASGAGKSTMMAGLAGVLGGDEEGEQEGSLTIDGVDAREARGRVGLVLQDPDSQIILERLGDDAAFGCENLNVPREEIRQRVRESLDMVGLGGLELDRSTRHLSGGQRQRICIARALALNPEFIVCDHPLSALHETIQAQIINLLNELQDKYKLTYLFISHDLSVVEHISDTVGVMYLGNLVEYGAKEDIFRNPLHPYTKALFSAIPIPDPKVKMNRIVLEGSIPSPANPPKGCKFHTRCSNCMACCKEEAPVQREIEPGHFVCCHLYDK